MGNGCFKVLLSKERKNQRFQGQKFKSYRGFTLQDDQNVEIFVIGSGQAALDSTYKEHIPPC